MKKNQILPYDEDDESLAVKNTNNQQHQQLQEYSGVSVNEEEGEQSLIPTNHLRITVEKLLNGQSGKFLDYFTASISFITAALFILSTYIDGKFSWLDTLDLVVLVYYSLEFALRLWSAPHSINFLIKASSVIDILCILPIFVLTNYDQDTFLGKLVNITRVIRILKVAMVTNKHYKSPDSEFSGVSQQLYQFQNEIQIKLFIIELLL